MKQRIIQFCDRIVFGDAISNHMLYLWRVYSDYGYESIISTSYIDERLPEKNDIIHVDKLKIEHDDIVIFHACGFYSYAFSFFINIICCKILIFHNETPIKFILDYAVPINSEIYYKNTPIYPDFIFNAINTGVKAFFDARRMKYIFPIVWTDSQYNAACLRKMNFKKINVLSIPFKRKDISIIPNSEILNEYSGTKNIIFVGRIVANKKQKHIIKAFSYYHKIEPKSKLFLIGEIVFSESYRDEYLSYAKSLGLENCVFMPGKVSNEDLEAYWEVSSLFLSMSEHEGFCVPLLEAMAHEVPILAYASSAICETLGQAGILFHSKNYLHIAETMNLIINNQDITNKLKIAGLEHIKKYDPDILAKQSVDLLEESISYFKENK